MESSLLDVLKGHVVKDMDEKKQVLTMRVLIVVFIAVSVIIAGIQYKSNITFIAQLMGVSWGALAGAFLAPFLYGLYWKRTTKADRVDMDAESTKMATKPIRIGESPESMVGITESYPFAAISI